MKDIFKCNELVDTRFPLQLFICADQSRYHTDLMENISFGQIRLHFQLRYSMLCNIIDMENGYTLAK